MKKFCLFLLVFVSWFCSACTTPVDNTTMSIQPSNFSKETQEVLEIFDDEVVFFDCNLDESVASYAVDLWAYQDGKWILKGNTSGSIERLNNRLALRLMDNGYDLYIIDESGYSKYSADDIGTDFSVSTSVLSKKITNPVPIECNKEIPLWVKIGTDKHGISLGEAYDFRNADCNSGVAITVTFSDKQV